jgi:hypothetical protein
MGELLHTGEASHVSSVLESKLLFVERKMGELPHLSFYKK